jgi:hypothetical protein
MYIDGTIQLIIHRCSEMFLHPLSAYEADGFRAVTVGD